LAHEASSSPAENTVHLPFGTSLTFTSHPPPPHHIQPSHGHTPKEEAILQHYHSVRAHEMDWGRGAKAVKKQGLAPMERAEALARRTLEREYSATGFTKVSGIGGLWGARVGEGEGGASIRV
ncbi:hypothetical protein HDU96_002640, partial [Phlyctochytrium bullatum]